MKLARLVAIVIAASLATPAATAFATPDAAHLAQVRADNAAKAYASTATAWQAGTLSLDTVCQWSERWVRAAVDAGPPKAASQALTDHLARMNELAKLVAARYMQGLANITELDTIHYYAAEAELWQARGKPD